jgi:hypothetical protein
MITVKILRNLRDHVIYKTIIKVKIFDNNANNNEKLSPGCEQIKCIYLFLCINFFLIMTFPCFLGL